MDTARDVTHESEVPGMKRAMLMLALSFKGVTGRDGAMVSTDASHLGKSNSKRSFCTAKRKNTAASIRKNGVTARNESEVIT
jgi:hypothetical protein